MMVIETGIPCRIDGKCSFSTRLIPFSVVKLRPAILIKGEGGRGKSYRREVEGKRGRRI